MAPVLSTGPHDVTAIREWAVSNEHLAQPLRWVKTGAGWQEADRRPAMPVNTDVSGWCGGSVYDY